MFQNFFRWETWNLQYLKSNVFFIDKGDGIHQNILPENFLRTSICKYKKETKTDEKKIIETCFGEVRES